MSAIISVLYATGVLKGGIPPNASLVNDSSNGSSTSDRSAELGCDWWNPSYGQHEKDRCVGMSLRMATTSALDSATSRAFDCARAMGETCVFSYDVGFPIPAVFVWNATTGKMVALLVPQRDVLFEERQSKIHVSVGDPIEDDPNVRHTFVLHNRTRIEYVSTGLRMQTLVLEGMDAYCVQMLNRTISEGCAAAFDL